MNTKSIRLFTLLFLSAFLFGCSAKKTLTVIPLQSFKVDMSAYKGVRSADHHFLGTAPDELFRCIEEKASAIFYIGDTGCPNCQEAAHLIEQAAEELDVTVYYLDAYSKQYPLRDRVEELKAALDPVLTEINGSKDIYMPFLFTIENGVPVKGYSGILPDFKDDEVSRSKMIDIYKEIMEDFK